MMPDPVTIQDLSNERHHVGSRTLMVWAALFVGCALLYALTAARGAQWQDSGYHILRVVLHEPFNPLGLALSHPLHHWLGRAAVATGLFEPALAVTLISALAGGLAVANVYGCTLTLTRQQGAALFAALSLALAHTFWRMATLAECYTLSLALLSAECWCVAAAVGGRWRFGLALAFLFNGLNVANHMQAALTAPVWVVVALLAWRRGMVRGRDVGLMAGLWLVGASLYLAMVVQEAWRTGEAAAAVHSALFGLGYAEAVLNVVPSARHLLISGLFTLLSFPNLLLPLAGVGLMRGAPVEPSKMMRRALLVALGIHALFALRYDIPDQYTFLLPAYVLLCLFAGLGFAHLRAALAPARGRGVAMLAGVMLAVTPVWYALAPIAARKLDALGAQAHRKPYRDDYVYLFTPWSVADGSAARMSRAALDLAGAEGRIVVEDRMALFAVRYEAWRRGREADAVLHEPSDDALAALVATGHPLVLVPRDREEPATPVPAGTSWRREGDLYVVER